MYHSNKLNDKELIFSQLCEIFRFDKDTILSICKNQDWRIDDCIENLIAYGNYLSSKETETSSNCELDLKNYNEIVIKGISRSTQQSKLNYLGAVPKNIHNDQIFRDDLSNNGKIKIIVDHIVAGHKIMVLLRGPPGSGKTYLANELVKFVDELEKYESKFFICSTDDFFYDINDKYNFEPEKLSDAHEFNQTKVRRKAIDGVSPIIVDNTNIKIWEMLSYVQMGVQYGYIIELLEPNTPWRYSAAKLAMKNNHGVPKDKIKRLLINFESVTEKELLKIIKTTYSVSLPQLRSYPPLKTQKIMSHKNEQIMIENSKYNKNLVDLDGSCSNYYCINIKKNDMQCAANNSNPNSFNRFSNKISSNYMKCDSNIRREKEINLVNNEKTTSINESSQKSIPLENCKISQEFKLFNFGEEKTQNQSLDFYNYLDLNDKVKEKDVLLIQSKSNIYENATNVCNKEKANDWLPYETESNEFWNIDQKQIEELVIPKNSKNLTNITSSPEKHEFDILKNIERHNLIKMTCAKDHIVNSGLMRHAIDCPNENKSFELIRQICPHKDVNSLWDLFENCNGNAEWVLDILLKDESSCEISNDNLEICDYKCKCNDLEIISNKFEHSTNEILEHHPKNGFNNSLQKQKNKKEKICMPDELLEVKRKIENMVVINKSQSSENLTQRWNTNNSTKKSLLEGDDDKCTFSDDKEMIEINLGNDLIQQLEALFASRPIPKLRNPKTKIFMPKFLGKQLYALWMESIYNQLEEEKQETMKNDEEFAMLLQSSSGNNSGIQDSYKDILEMEIAWSNYKRNPDQWKNTSHQNLASHLSHIKLCEMFPDIEKDSLFQILQAHENSFSQTVKALSCSIEKSSADINKKKQNLLDLATAESESIEEPLFCEKNNSAKTISSDESKKAALHDFEECRNLAAHHSQLKGECYEKAKEAIQKGNSAVAVYYSQISNLHKNKIEFYNHKAANCIMEVHDLTQNNPDFIDLHYLYTMEALECLDIFLDNHILKLRSINRPYKHIFIITGRGLHSAKGVSTIKNKVKSRLKDRTLKWSEVNPGLLKVKVFSASKFSRNS